MELSSVFAELSPREALGALRRVPSSACELLRRPFHLQRRVVVLVTQSPHLGEEFRPRGFTGPFQLPGLTLEAPALWAQPARLGEIFQSFVAMALLEQLLAEAKVGCREPIV